MAEAVGFILAIVPLVISAFEDYRNTAACIRTFRNCSSILKTHLKTLRIQELIFRKAHERLLADCLDDDEHARQMLTDEAHPSWRDVEIAEEYVRRLGDARDAFEASIGLVSEALAAIRTKLGELEIPSDDSKHIRKRIKLAFKNSNIETSLDTLTERTRDFVSLVDLTQSRPTKTSRNACPLHVRKQVSQFSRVKETADDLYQALGSACTKHTDHQAHLSLEPVCCNPAQIRFNIAFSQLSLEPSPLEDKSTWLTVESRMTGRLESTTTGEGSLLQTQASLKRALRDFDTEEAGADVDSKGKTKTKRKVLRFQCQNDESTKVKSDKKNISPPLINLCTNSNFCTHLQTFIGQTQPSSIAIGYLELSGFSKHLLYVDAKWQAVTRKSKPGLISLYTVLQAPQQSTSPRSILSLGQKIRLAKRLATAILQFHTTPWIRNSISSRDVVVTSKDGEDDNDASLPEAYVSAQIRGPHGPIVRAQTMPSPAIVRNQLLFGLGKMLLEIAYQRPLSDMVINRDVDSSHPGNTEYFTADRLSRQVSAHIGSPKYAEVTRKCVHCDFGCDFDLKQSKLQEGFYQDVVCELEKLEDRVRGL